MSSRREAQPGRELRCDNGGALGNEADQEMDSNDELFRTPDNGIEAMEGMPREQAQLLEYPSRRNRTRI